MLAIQAAGQPLKTPRKACIGLAVAGGGPLGGMYELGALRALEEAITGLQPNQLDVYVGVSSGAFIAAGLANQLSSAEMCRLFLTGESQLGRFRPEIFLQPAFGEYLRGLARAPGVLVQGLAALARDPFGQSLSDHLGRLAGLLPTGVFSNDAIESFLRDLFTRDGRSNDFRTLARRLYIVAVELDSGKAVRFGAAGLDDVPISRAIQASSALPGLYPPVRIADTVYVDGALQRTLHASAALNEGARLVIGINPLVPFDAAVARANGRGRPTSLADGGLPAVLSQTFRALLQSRMQAGLSKYAHQYRHADIVLFEPNPDDAQMFFTNVFSYENRLQVAEHAYRSTLADLHLRRTELEPVLARHGLGLDAALVADTRRGLLDSVRPASARSSSATTRLRQALDELESSVATASAVRRLRTPAALANR